MNRRLDPKLKLWSWELSLLTVCLSVYRVQLIEKGNSYVRYAFFFVKKVTLFKNSSLQVDNILLKRLIKSIIIKMCISVLMRIKYLMI